ncbi:hypothetical protein PROFUN_07363 [Planoprotostelium fungivorum]|uniref:Uncharacterized protein n=1 Tax=Planoprotostelium fungivorum TaxID=1890364 RepID=A0A2P6NM40_9EUKA|nr:hypothetical protein PROFUN_07363 [Planoprotostelium fungivorum]
MLKVYEQMLRERDQVIADLTKRLRRYEEINYPPLSSSQEIPTTDEQKRDMLRSSKFFEPTTGSLYCDDDTSSVGSLTLVPASNDSSRSPTGDNCYHLSESEKTELISYELEEEDTADGYEVETVDADEDERKIEDIEGEEIDEEHEEEREGGGITTLDIDGIYELKRRSRGFTRTVKDKISRQPQDTTEPTIHKIMKKSVNTSYRDWNEEYQIWYEQFVRLIAPGDSVSLSGLKINSHVLTHLNRIAQQFVDTATIYAKIIISEFELPLHRKSIKPTEMGGVAGGTKYRVQNIMYKFAFDTLLVDEPALWMYGGQTADHRAASKGAANEMKGLEAHASTYVEGLSYPMMALVDYLGFRVVAMAVLPIDKTTLRYGSDDGGSTVHDDDAELSEKMRVAAERLKLKGHMTGHVKSSAKKIYGPGDIEGHRGHDGRLYVVDFSRLLPPADPSTRLQPKPRSVFYECLRPELLLSSTIPLCSDAFTSDEEEKRKENNEEVRATTRKMMREKMEKIRDELEAGADSWMGIRSEKWDEESWKRLFFMSSMMHTEGCNTRYLGMVWSLLKDEDLKRMIMSVAISRCAKSELREIMRLRMRQVQAPCEEDFNSPRKKLTVLSDFRSVAAKFLNQLIGHSKNSKLYWRRDLCRQLRDWFWFDLTEEQVANFHVRTMADKRIILNLTMSLSHIELLRRSKERARFNDNLGFFHLTHLDIKTIGAKARLRSDVYFSYGVLAMQKMIRCKDKSRDYHFDCGKHEMYKEYLMKQISLANIFLLLAMGNNPASGLYLLTWANSCMEMAKLQQVSEFMFRQILGAIFRSFEVWPVCPGRREILIDACKLYAESCERKGEMVKRDQLLHLAETADTTDFTERSRLFTFGSEKSACEEVSMKQKQGSWMHSPDSEIVSSTMLVIPLLLLTSNLRPFIMQYRRTALNLRADRGSSSDKFISDTLRILKSYLVRLSHVFVYLSKYPLVVMEGVTALQPRSIMTEGRWPADPVVPSVPATPASYMTLRAAGLSPSNRSTSMVNTSTPPDRPNRPKKAPPSRPARPDREDLIEEEGSILMLNAYDNKNGANNRTTLRTRSEGVLPSVSNSAAMSTYRIHILIEPLDIWKKIKFPDEPSIPVSKAVEQIGIHMLKDHHLHTYLMELNRSDGTVEVMPPHTMLQEYHVTESDHIEMKIKPHPMTMRFDQIHIIDLNGEVTAATVDPNGDGSQLINFVSMRYNLSSDEYILELMSTQHIIQPLVSLKEQGVVKGVMLIMRKADKKRLKEIEKSREASQNIKSSLGGEKTKGAELQAIRDYIAMNPGELSFKKGDQVVVLEEHDAGMWRGVINGKEGIFPVHYCRYNTLEKTQKDEKEKTMQRELENGLHAFKNMPGFGKKEKLDKNEGYGFDRTSGIMPAIVKDTIDMLYKTEAYKVEGLFRISGALSKILELRKKYSQGKAPDLNLEQSHTVAGLLKSFLRDLPHPLFTFELYSLFCSAVEIADLKGRLRCISSALNKLPPTNRVIVHRLFGFLHKMTLHVKECLMTASNIAIVFAPSLFRPEALTVESLMSDQGKRFIEALVNHFTEIFVDRRYDTLNHAKLPQAPEFEKLMIRSSTRVELSVTMEIKQRSSGQMNDELQLDDGTLSPRELADCIMAGNGQAVEQYLNDLDEKTADILRSQVTVTLKEVTFARLSFHLIRLQMLSNRGARFYRVGFVLFSQGYEYLFNTNKVKCSLDISPDLPETLAGVFKTTGQTEEREDESGPSAFVAEGLQFTGDGHLQVISIDSPNWYWTISATNSSTNFRYLLVQDDGNVALYSAKDGQGFWDTSSNGAVGVVNASDHSTQYTLTISDEGQLIHNNTNTSRILWKSPIITSTDSSNIKTTDGGLLLIYGYFNLTGATPMVTFGNKSILLNDTSLAGLLSVQIPQGTGRGLSLKISIGKTVVQTFYDYPTPTLSATSPSPGTIIVEGTNAGNSSSIYVFGKQNEGITRAAVNGSSFERTFTLSPFVPSGNYTVELVWPDGTAFQTYVYYQSYAQSIEALNLNTTSPSLLFTTIEDVVNRALSTSDTFTIDNGRGISLQAANIKKNGSTVEGSLNATRFSIPSVVVDSLFDKNDTRLSYIFSALSDNIFPEDKEWNVMGSIVGLSLYANGSHLNVNNTTSSINVIIPASTNRTDLTCLYWSQNTSSWRRDGCNTLVNVGSVTCSCYHLTNFTLGEIRGEEKSSFNRLYLLAILVIVAVVSVWVIKRGKREYHRDITLETNKDVVVEREIGRGLHTIIYLATMGGTTTVALKKTEDEKRGVQLMKEYSILKNLHHPHLLLAFENYVEDTATCLVVEYMECGTLEQVLKSDVTYSDEQIDSVMGQICSALIYLHENGIIHGRICPRKIYMSTFVDIKLSVRGTESWEGVTEDTRGFIAPEVVKKRMYTMKGDVYSYGALFDRVKKRREGEAPMAWGDIVSSWLDNVYVEQ